MRLHGWRRRIGLIGLGALSIVLALPLQAQPRSASGAYKAKDYPLCARLYAVQADRSPPVQGAAYAAASCLALAGEADAALERLQRAPSDQLRSQIAEDPDFVPLHDDPRWDALLARYRTDMQAELEDLDHALLAELERRVDRDQALRNRSMAAPSDPAINEELGRVDADNTAWLKAYLSEHGWPPYALVGRSGSQGFWLLAQHADADPQFQEQVLVLLGKAVARGEASGIHLAYLTDRVRVAQGKPQVYGTQFWQVEGVLQPRPLEDPDGVDARRGALGMPTLAEYAATMEDLHASPH